MAGPLVLLGALNALTFAMFGFDKARARTGGQRVREAALLWLAALGGSAGAWAGRGLFRHKTRKSRFTAWLVALSAAQVLVLAWWLRRDVA